MLLLLLITAMAIYIYRFADIDECSCIPSEDCRTCPFPCDQHKN